MIKSFKKKIITYRNPKVAGDIGQLVIAVNEIIDKLNEIIDEVNKLKEVKEND